MGEWWNGYADKAQFPAAVIQKVDDQVMGVQGFVNLIGLWYNQDILDKLGVKPPTTFEALEKDMALARSKGFGAITLTGKPNSEGEWQAFPWLSRFGWKYDAPAQQPLEQAFSMIQDWTKKGYLTKEASTWDQTVPFQKFSAGKTAVAVNGNWQIASAKQNAKFKYGVVPNMMIAFSICVFPILLTTVRGLREVEPDLLDLVKSLRGSRWTLFRKIQLPGSLPYIFSGMKVGAILAVAGAIVGEFIASERGLGYLMIQVQSSLDTPAMVMAVVLLTLLGVALYGFVLALERMFVVGDATPT
jgi:ABC-type proline/glycine betaine transport system permease subunit